MHTEIAKKKKRKKETYFSTTVPMFLQASSAASLNAKSGWAIFTKSA